LRSGNINPPTLFLIEISLAYFGLFTLSYIFLNQGMYMVLEHTHGTHKAGGSHTYKIMLSIGFSISIKFFGFIFLVRKRDTASLLNELLVSKKGIIHINVPTMVVY
jgi:hypothetical protein